MFFRFNFEILFLVSIKMNRIENDLNSLKFVQNELRISSF